MRASVTTGMRRPRIVDALTTGILPRPSTHGYAEERCLNVRLAHWFVTADERDQLPEYVGRPGRDSPAVGLFAGRSDRRDQRGLRRTIVGQSQLFLNLAESSRRRLSDGDRDADLAGGIHGPVALPESGRRRGLLVGSGAQGNGQAAVTERDGFLTTVLIGCARSVLHVERRDKPGPLAIDDGRLCRLDGTHRRDRSEDRRRLRDRRRSRGAIFTAGEGDGCYYEWGDALHGSPPNTVWSSQAEDRQPPGHNPLPWRNRHNIRAHSQEGVKDTSCPPAP